MQKAPPMNKMVQETYTWIDEACFRLGTDDRKQAWHALRGVFFALRDRLPCDEAFDLAAQLPTVLRGLFFEGYRPSHKPEKFGPQEFLLRIDDELVMANMGDPQYAAQVIFGILEDHVSPGEMDDIFFALPQSIRCVLTGEHQFSGRDLQMADENRRSRRLGRNRACRTFFPTMRRQRPEAERPRREHQEEMMEELLSNEERAYSEI